MARCIYGVEGCTAPSHYPYNKISQPARKLTAESVSTRFYLNVPYAEKNAAKKLGAWWDAEAKKWYVPNGKNRNAFRKWFIGETAQVTTRVTIEEVVSQPVVSQPVVDVKGQSATWDELMSALGTTTEKVQNVDVVMLQHVAVRNKH